MVCAYTPKAQNKFRGGFMKLSLLVILALSLAFVSCTENNDDKAAPAVVVVEQAVELKPICKPSQNAITSAEKPIVILVSIDGLRADYIEKHKPANILNIIKQGIYTLAMIPSYPTLTFPNHYSIATGRYPGHHGIVSNKFYDSKRKEAYNAFEPKIANDSTWYEGEPLWNVAEKNGMIAHTIDWVGSSAHVGQMDPTCYTQYDPKITFAQKIDKAFEALSMPEDVRPHFITLYTAEVDDAGHYDGPYSDKTVASLMNVDKELGRLWNLIQKSELPINLIVVSDHGMEQLNNEKVVFLEDYVPTADLLTFKYSDRGATMMMYNEDPAQVQSAYAALKANEKNYKVYLKGQTPPQYFLDHSTRTGDIVLIPDIPYYVDQYRPVQGLKVSLKAGTHGWAPENKEMHAFFMAAGNNIAINKTIPHFKNVDIYPFVLNILGVSTSVPFDGDEKTLKSYIVR
jgi:predicted AlkP superfamily pyrophosphatase or phosphodiesterase